MKFKILSHACMLIQTAHASIIIDPWLVGACYWRSWWNFPTPEFEEDELLSVDAVFISHIHWDHWHGVSLKKFFRGKAVYIPDEPGVRSEHDLRSIGFDRIIRVPHGETVHVKDVAVTMYQFGLLLNDSAIVIESEGVKLLNANDAKIAGTALNQIISRHGKFNFAFRSHSSANPRICYAVEGEEGFVNDDRNHYFRSFAAFMDQVRPEVAIPFASNHCHLQEDVFELNYYISNPLQLREFVNQRTRPSGWVLQVMLPGSEWSAESGFRLRSEQCFTNLEEELRKYRSQAAPRLDHYRAYENSVKISDSLLARFLGIFQGTASIFAPRGKFLLSLTWPDGRGRSIRFNPREPRVEETEFTMSSSQGLPLMIFPAVVFRDAVVKNMFHHAAISKRCRFLARSPADLKRLYAVMSVLEKTEHGLLPLQSSYVKSLMLAYVRRWRELFVYAHALWLLKVRRKPMFLAEEAILRGEY